jgi:hypothetical protein
LINERLLHHTPAFVVAGPRSLYRVHKMTDCPTVGAELIATLCDALLGFKPMEQIGHRRARIFRLVNGKPRDAMSRRRDQRCR